MHDLRIDQRLLLSDRRPLTICRTMSSAASTIARQRPL
jgi:hypothetical protein